MLAQPRYIPILRWKLAERAALKELRPGEKDALTPLVVVGPSALKPEVPRSGTEAHAAISKISSQIHEVWEDRPLFVDLGRIDAALFTPFGLHPVTALWKASGTLFPSLFPKLIPVTTLHRDLDFQKAVRLVVEDYDVGLCLRLMKSDLQDKLLKRKIEAILAWSGLIPADVDLVIDYESIDTPQQDYLSACMQTPFLADWKTFTIAAGSFPKDLQGLAAHDAHYLDRPEWAAWCALFDNADSLPRLPLYGDYTVQHPAFEEHKGPANTTASIRYTIDGQFLIMRGEWLRKLGGLGYTQYPAQAELLSNLPEFSGGAFSAGDGYIQDKAIEYRTTGNATDPGSPTTWLQAAFNHHMVLVLHQTASRMRTSMTRLMTHPPMVALN